MTELSFFVCEINSNMNDAKLIYIYIYIYIYIIWTNQPVSFAPKKSFKGANQVKWTPSVINCTLRVKPQR